MRIEDFDYDLPNELIASQPAAKRDASRLLALERATGRTSHHLFSDLPNLLRAGDCLVVNDSRVMAARLLGRRETGGAVELLLVEPRGKGIWLAWAKPAKKLRAGARVRIGADGAEKAEIEITGETPEGERLVRGVGGESIESILARHGRTPLPPYIVKARQTERADQDALDRERYQTVYARAAGSVAAPTAGLHFTKELLRELALKDIETRRVTLHVGPGTFAPVKTSDVRRHRMHKERFSIEEEEAEAIERARADPARRIVAVGTTVTRVLETLMRRSGRIAPGSGETDLMLAPGDDLMAIDTLITNFHLPRSTLLMLISAFAGREKVFAAYRTAIAEEYRFYSYGDAMLID